MVAEGEQMTICKKCGKSIGGSTMVSIDDKEHLIYTIHPFSSKQKGDPWDEINLCLNCMKKADKLLQNWLNSQVNK